MNLYVHKKKYNMIIFIVGLEGLVVKLLVQGLVVNMVWVPIKLVVKVVKVLKVQSDLHCLKVVKVLKVQSDLLCSKVVKVLKVQSDLHCLKVVKVLKV